MKLGGRQPGKRRRGRVIILSAGAVVLIGVLAWLVLFSSVFAVRTVEVQGAALLSSQEVLDQAEAPLGVPLARVSERKIAERVAQLPAVAQVTVRRKLPGTVLILLTERVPVFAIGNGGQAVLVDAAGATFSGPRGEGLPTGEGSLSDPALLAGAAAVVNALPPDVRIRAATVKFTSRDAITVTLSDGVEVFFGSAEQAQLKGEVALALLRGTSAKRIDVSAPTRPVTR